MLEAAHSEVVVIANHRAPGAAAPRAIFDAPEVIRALSTDSLHVSSPSTVP